MTIWIRSRLMRRMKPFGIVWNAHDRFVVCGPFGLRLK